LKNIINGDPSLYNELMLLSLARFVLTILFYHQTVQMKMQGCVNIFEGSVACISVNTLKNSSVLSFARCE
jgi:hypothetical protein